MKRYVPLSTFCLLAGACGPAPPRTLDEALEGQAPGLHREILLEACLDEARWPSRTRIPTEQLMNRRVHAGRYADPTVGDAKALCREMDSLGDPEAAPHTQRAALEATCADLVRNKGRDGRAGFAEHAARLRRICDEMLRRDRE